MKRGYVQIYTGDGKGKTTAALGLALRAVGAGFKVFIAQFCKGTDCSELKSIERMGEQITLRRYGAERFITDKADDQDISLARQGLIDCADAIQSGKYQLVIMDEANVAVHMGLISVDEILELIKSKPPELELVLTGRWADERLMEIADLVTEMREIKHYYNDGVVARRGIEK